MIIASAIKILILQTAFLRQINNVSIKFPIHLSVGLHNSFNVSSENLVLDERILPKLIFYFILNPYLVDTLY